jgi:hypothetical protein
MPVHRFSPLIIAAATIQLSQCAFAGDSVPARPQPAASESYYRAPQSYSTSRDPDVPKYAKHAPDSGLGLLSSAAWLDLGADYRLRYEYRSDDIRRSVGGVDEPYLQRTRIYLGVHDVLDPLRFAVEMQDSRRWGGRFPLDTRDVNEFELIRLQAELYFKDALGVDPKGNERPVSLRYGIQNFEFLDRRLIGNNQWRNTANTFRGFRGALGQEANDWQLDLLAVQPLLREKYEADQPVDGQWVYAAIGHWRRWSDVVTLEPFYLALKQDADLQTPERRVHSPGLRAYGFFGKTGFDFDFDVVGQFGHQGAQDVKAFGTTAELGYRFKQPWAPRFSVFYGYASGDRSPVDGQDNRFEKFYGFGRPWSANDYIVFENIHTPKVRLEFAPLKSLRVDLGYSWYYLASDTDRLAPANNLRDRSGNSGNSVGHEFDVRARWQVNPNLEAIAGYAHFTAGEFTRNTLRPDNTDFAYLELNVLAF